MKVMNIGIIIRNDHDDTFPVALTPQMVSVIQNLLTQIPVMKSNIVDAAGKKVAAGQPSIPIIPRYVDFDWDKAYQPMLPDEEAELMKSLQAKYKLDEDNKPVEAEASDAAKLVVPEGMDTGKEDPEKKITPLFTDKDNPFNMELNASGTANADIGEDITEEDAEYKKKHGAPLTGAGKSNEEMSELAKVANERLDGQDCPAPEKGQDCTVTPEPLKLNGDSKPIGG